MDLTETINRALKVMRFMIHTRLKNMSFELHHGRKPRTELTNIIKDGNSFLSDWSELSILAPNQSKISIHVGGDAEGEITNHLVMARTKTKERYFALEAKLSMKKTPVSYPFNFVGKRHNRKSLKVGSNQKYKPQ